MLHDGDVNIENNQKLPPNRSQIINMSNSSFFHTIDIFMCDFFCLLILMVFCFCFFFVFFVQSVTIHHDIHILVLSHGFH